uniref:Protein sleepless n=1 Tax=Cacopsylla melanoneura TaxID=428564 RepID=A0A8D8ZZ18_9HEMI
MSVIHNLGFLCLIVFANEARAHVTCYACTMSGSDPYAPPDTPKRPCAQFDGSARFQVDCPYSTFCMKKTFQMQLGGGRKATGIVRDCAPQKHSYQAYENQKWGEKHEVIESIYTAGCNDDTNFLKTSEAQYCYCSSNLCNSAPSSGAALKLVFSLLGLFVVLQSRV